VLAQHEQAAQALDHGNSSVTSAVLAGTRKEAIGRSVQSSTMPSMTCFKMPAVVFGMPVLAQVLAAGSPRITMTSCR